MITVGIDLASQPLKTAGCVIEWAANGAKVSVLRSGLTDDDILALAQDADTIAIDAPFGWPQPFIAFLNRPMDLAAAPTWEPGLRDRLCFRRTDLHVRQQFGKNPLSVSSDKIAITAMRCAGLLGRLGITDRSGSGRVVEAYPAAALRAWGFTSSGYKKGPDLSGTNEPLVALLRAVMTACPWLMLDERTAEHCSRSDHAIDSLIAALVGRVAALGLFVPPPDEDLALAKTEGWIVVPRAGTLDQLV